MLSPYLLSAGTAVFAQILYLACTSTSILQVIIGTGLQLEHVLMYVLLIGLNMYTRGHMQKCTCT